jgi:hypothetical protein
MLNIIERIQDFSMHSFQRVNLSRYFTCVIFDAIIRVHIVDSLEDGYEQLRDLVISYLGLEDDRLDDARPTTYDEIKRFDDFDIQRSGSFQSCLDRIFTCNS